MNYYLDAWKKFSEFDGRSRRKEFWIFALINVAINYLINFLIPYLGLVGWIIMGAFGLAILLPTIAVAIRRMHDIGKSGWWVCINFVPLIGSIWYLILTAKDSERNSNQWGACPK